MQPEASKQTMTSTTATQTLAARLRDDEVAVALARTLSQDNHLATEGGTVALSMLLDAFREGHTRIVPMGSAQEAPIEVVFDARTRGELFGAPGEATAAAVLRDGLWVQYQVMRERMLETPPEGIMVDAVCAYGDYLEKHHPDGLSEVDEAAQRAFDPFESVVIPAFLPAPEPALQEPSRKTAPGMTQRERVEAEVARLRQARVREAKRYARENWGLLTGIVATAAGVGGAIWISNAREDAP